MIVRTQCSKDASQIKIGKHQLDVIGKDPLADSKIQTLIIPITSLGISLMVTVT